jgi:hypothetical protein
MGSIFMPKASLREKLAKTKNYFPKRIFVIAILLASAIVFQECKTNKCDGCPALKKKVRKSSKGSI